MNDKPLVSVIIPTYKRPLTLSRAVNSVLNQTYKNIEIIVVDDNNEGDPYRIETQQLMDKMYGGVSSVVYIKHKYNKNGSAARNTGFKQSHGDFVMFLDDDDEFMPKKVEQQVATLCSLGLEWGACYSSYIRRKNGKTIVRSGEKRQGDLLVDELARNLFVHAGSNLMIRRKSFEEIGGFDESFKRNQDVEMLCRLLKKNKLAFTNYVGLVVNVHSGVSTVDFLELTRQYIDKFRPIIDGLPIQQSAQVYKMINLQIYRYFLTKKDFKNAKLTVKKGNISFILKMKYLFYLAIRFLTKKSFGFSLKNI